MMWKRIASGVAMVALAAGLAACSQATPAPAASSTFAAPAAGISAGTPGVPSRAGLQFAVDRGDATSTALAWATAQGQWDTRSDAGPVASIKQAATVYGTDAFAAKWAAFEQGSGPGIEWYDALDADGWMKAEATQTRFGARPADTSSKAYRAVQVDRWITDDSGSMTSAGQQVWAVSLTRGTVLGQWEIEEATQQ